MVNSELMDGETGGRLGMVVSGSLTEGVQVKLDPDSSVEAVKVGTFVTLQGERMRFFGVVTDVSLGSTDLDTEREPARRVGPVRGPGDLRHGCVRRAECRADAHHRRRRP